MSFHLKKICKHIVLLFIIIKYANIHLEFAVLFEEALLVVRQRLFQPPQPLSVMLNLLLYCCYTGVTQSHCCYTVVTLFLHVATLLLQWCYTVVAPPMRPRSRNQEK